MNHGRRDRRRDGLRGALLALVVGGGLPAAQAFREDEFLCEEAAIHLEECCPDLEVGELDCTFSMGCGSTTYPGLTPEESDCIRERPCDALREQGVCEKVQARRGPIEEDDLPTDAVCQ